MTRIGDKVFQLDFGGVDDGMDETTNAIDRFGHTFERISDRWEKKSDEWHKTACSALELMNLVFLVGVSLAATSAFVPIADKVTWTQGAPFVDAIVPFAFFCLFYTWAASKLTGAKRLNKIVSEH